jgi:cation:H+ antiporter
LSHGWSHRARRKNLTFLTLGLISPLPWILSSSSPEMGIRAELIAPISGVAILGAAFLLSWASELAERYMPQSLTLLFLALVSVLPEYAIDLHFAWQAGVDPSYAPYAVANMTGANRILIGLGWAAVVLTACWKSGSDHLAVHPRQRLELRFLIWATLYSFFIPFGGEIGLIDAVALLALFGVYVKAATASELHEAEIDLAGPAQWIDRNCGDLGRRVWSLGLFVYAGFAIYLAAEPFAESLVTLGRHYAIDEFLLVQWVAPIASETPEFIIAILFALRLRGSLGIGALISSKVNQWTLLVGGIPIAYAISSGTFSGLPLDARQTGEIWLTSAQSLLAVVLVADLRFGRREALGLAILFAGQLVSTSSAVRSFFVVLYLCLAVGLLAFGSRSQRRDFFGLMFSSPFPKSRSLTGDTM